MSSNRLVSEVPGIASGTVLCFCQNVPASYNSQFWKLGGLQTFSLAFYAVWFTSVAIGLSLMYMELY
jgi:hypothetical protein